jgi:tetratricopeptide (TPR) repeat protein/predicted AlkP superfamily pyrophosphatase or phosphodiesterase
MRGRAAALAIALASLTIAAGCSRGATATERRAPVVVIGLDGADWDIVDPLIAAGKMPNLGRLKAGGVCGPLATLPDLAISPVIWTSIATGKLPAKHGVTWFLVDLPGGKRVPVRSSDRRVKAIWNVLAERKRAVGVVGWWATAPAEDVGAGVVVSDALGWHGFGRTGRGIEDSQRVWPARRDAEFAALIPPLQQIDHEFARRFFHLSASDYYARAFQPARSAEPDPDDEIQLFQEYAATTIGYTACARKLLEEGALDLLLVYFESTDSLSHLFMKDAPPKLDWISDADFERYRDVVDRWYEFVDEKLGELLAPLPSGSTVIVVSDHGFRIGADRPRSVTSIDVRGAHLDHDPLGIFVANGPDFRRGEQIEGASVLDVAPTLLHCLGEPVASDFDGRVLSEAFTPGFLASHPIRHVATFEDGAEPVASPSAASPAANDGFDEDASIAQLRRLGYVAGSDSDDVGTSLEQRLNLGETLLRSGDLAGARREFEAAAKAAPDRPAPLVSLSQVAAKEGRPDEAVRSLARALALDPGCVAALLALASIRKDRDELRVAEALYRQALAIDARLPDPWVSLGDVLARQNRLDEAEEALAHALELDPRSLEARYNVGVVHMQRGENAAAEADYRKALELDPKHAPTLNNLGHVMQACGRTDEALASFEAAAKADPNHFESRFNLGSVLLSLGRAEEAVPWLEAALVLKPELLLAQLQSARALAAAGKREDAQRRFLAIVRMFPLDGAACIELARLEMAATRPEEAGRWLAQAVQRGGAPAKAAIRRDAAFQSLDLDALLGAAR